MASSHCSHFHFLEGLCTESFNEDATQLLEGALHTSNCVQQDSRPQKPA